MGWGCIKMLTDEELHEIIDRLEEIKNEIVELVGEADYLVRAAAGYKSMEYARAEQYWIPGIKKHVCGTGIHNSISTTITELNESLEDK